MHFLADPARLLPFLLACSLKATLLLAIAWILVWLFRRRSSALRHLIWAVAIFSSLALPLVALLLPRWPSATLNSTTVAWIASHAVEPIVGPQTLSTAAINATTSSPLLARLPSLILLLWILGGMFFAMRIAAGFVRLLWLSRRAEPVFDPRFLRMVLGSSHRLDLRRLPKILLLRDSFAMPLTWGFFRPVVLLPCSALQWPDSRLQLVIVHELAHIARADWLCQFAAELSRAFYWFHPLAWFAAARLRHESERACDDSVLATGTPAADYADQLLDLARTLKNPHRAWTTALAFARPTHLERRFAAMLDSNVDRRRLSSKARFLSVAFALCLMIPFAALRLSAQNVAETFSGTIHDPSGAPVANATIIMSDHKTNKTEMTTSGADGTYKFASLPAGDYDMKVVRAGFQEFQRPGISLQSGRDSSQDVTLNLGSVNEEVNVEAKAHESGPKKPAPRIKLGGNVKPPTPITKVQPAYPEKAKSEGVQGSVVLRAVIGIKGDLLSLRVVNSDVNPDLARAAVEAVNQWHYQPVLLNGNPVEVDTNITVNFTLKP